MVSAVDAWHPTGPVRRVLVRRQRTSVRDARHRTVLRLRHGSNSSRKPQDIVDGDGDIHSLAYVDEGRSLLAGDMSTAGPNIVDAETLRPRGEPFDVPANCCTTPIGDGSTAMVYEMVRGRALYALAGDRRQHWRGPFPGRRGPGVRASIRRLPGRLDGGGGRGPQPDRDHRRLDRREKRRSTGLGAAVLWLKYSDDGERCWSPARPTAGSACGTPRRWTCLAPCTRPTMESRSRPARSSSATATTWRSRRTTARSTGGRPTSTGPSTSPARWPGGT